MERICIIGALDFTKMSTGGQPVKTRELYYALQEKYGKNNIFYLDTANWKKNPFYLLLNLWKYSKNCDTFIMLPAMNGLKVFSKILLYFKNKKNISLYYDVIGGWLPNVLKENSSVKANLKKFDGIWLETKTMYDCMRSMGFDNVTIVNNFKNINPIPLEKKCKDTYKIIRFCMFSRVNANKGITEAINAVNCINSEIKDRKVYLDIFGPVESDYQEEFNRLLNNSSSMIQYKGVANPDKSALVLKDYNALLFPTKYYTEGIPGTVIDAYFAGIPVIASRWESAYDVIDEGSTGYTFEFNNYNEFLSLLRAVIYEPEKLSMLKQNCINKSYLYTRQYFLTLINDILH